jgi:hypothetical protein
MISCTVLMRHYTLSGKIFVDENVVGAAVRAIRKYVLPRIGCSERNRVDSCDNGLN